MKIRNSFVSNSSSASFVLEVRKPKEEFLDILLKELPQYFERNNFKKILISTLKKEKEYANECQLKQKEDEEAKKKGIKEPPLRLYSIWLPQVEGKIKQYTKLFNEFDNISDKQLILEALEFYGYHRNFPNSLGDCEISGWTTIWNDDEDMGEVLLEIKSILDTKYKNTITYRFQVYDD